MTVLVRNAALLAAIASVVATPSAFSASPTRFADISTEGATLPFIPRSIDTTPVTVVVIMHGDSVTSVQRSVGRPLTRPERDSVIAARTAEQAAMAPEIIRRGGTVLAGFRSALNAVKVSIPKNRLGQLKSIPGVLDVKPVGTYRPNNVNGVPLVGAPAVWQGLAQLRGEGVKVAIIDTGIDYTHANFGGPGTVAAFNTAKAGSTGPANPSLFGPSAPKVKGGIDLVGDAYTGSNTPVPDPNPLDCNGHGSHVAGTAAGFGVSANGSTYAGPYTAAAYTPGAFSIGPGVAPKADLYAVRVFGCTGSTNVVVDAIDWAVAQGMDVISMSLGSDWGAADNAETAAIANASAAGILVVASSGNSGPSPYIAGSPASSDGVIAVAATDALSAVPVATLALTGVGSPVTVQNSNGALFANGVNYPVVVLRNANGTVSLGCNEAEYDKTRNGGIDIAGKLVVTLRGTCARVYRAGAGQHYGAAAVAMINNAASFPSYEGPIPGGDPAANPFEAVTIPFFGVRPADAAALTGPTGGPAPANAVATNAGAIANPGFEIAASFSSAGPRVGDSALRPGITAPGVSVVSTAVGSGNGFATISGTSMAAPHVAGVAALVRQQNKTWPVADQRSAIVQTASPSMMKDYSPRLEGAGLAQVGAAVATQAVVRVANDSLSFGYSDLLQDFTATRQLTVHNDGTKAVQFNIAVTKVVGPAGATVTAPASVIVNAKSDAQFPVTLTVPGGSLTSRDANGNAAFQDVGGYVQLTPSSSRLNGNAKLTVPYYFVGNTRSNLASSANSIASSGNTNLTVSNAGGLQAGEPDFYTLGLQQPTPQGIFQADTRAVGVQSVPSGSNPFLVFAINTHDRFSNAAGFQEWDILIDSTGGNNPRSNPNFVLIGINGAAVTTAAAAQNTLVAALLNVSTGAITAIRLAPVSTDSSTVWLVVRASEIGVTAANPRFAYAENHFSSNGVGSGTPGVAKFNAFNPSLSVSGGGPVAPNGSVGATVSVNGEWANTPGAGLMIVAPDNTSGAGQALLLPAAAPN